MSIALLKETREEVKRLVIAGGNLAVGDFRLKRILPGMKASGEKAPIFSRIAKAIEKVVEKQGTDVNMDLLDLSSLINAVLYTQGESAVKDEITDFETLDMDMNTTVTARRMKEVINALTTTGQGRYEIFYSAYRDGLFKDLRLIKYLVNALDDSYIEISSEAEKYILEMGKPLLPLLKKDLDINGKRLDARKMKIIGKLSGQEDKDLYLNAAKNGSTEVRAEAIRLLVDFPDQMDFILEQSHDKKKDIRQAAVFALSGMNNDAAYERILGLFEGKDSEIAMPALRNTYTERMASDLSEMGDKLLGDLINEHAVPVTDKMNNLAYKIGMILYIFEGKKNPKALSFAKKVLEGPKFLTDYSMRMDGQTYYYIQRDLKKYAAIVLLKSEDKKMLKFLEAYDKDHKEDLVFYRMLAAMRLYDKDYIFDSYSGYVASKKKKSIAYDAVVNILNHNVSYPGDIQKAIDDSNIYYYRNSYRYEDYVEEYSLNNPGLFDDRWINCLIDSNNVNLVSKLIKPGMKKAEDFLYKKLKESKNIARSMDETYNAITGLYISGNTSHYDILIEKIDSSLKSNENYNLYYLDNFIKFLQIYPVPFAEKLKKYIDDTDKFIEKAISDAKNDKETLKLIENFKEYKGKIQEVAEKILNKNQEKNNDKK